MSNDAWMNEAEKRIRKMIGDDIKSGKPVKDPNAMEHDVLTFDREAVKKSLKESRMRHTVRVRSILP